LITVDDGWLCAYTEIFPELRRRGMPWTLFVYPKIVGRGEHAVTWAQVAEMAEAGADVESHTWTHSSLTLASNNPELLDHELADSRKTIEQKSGASVRFLSYPYGDYDPTVIAAAEAGGYEAAVTTRRAPIAPSSSPFALTRYLIHNDTTLEELKTFLLP
jgi:peptidoglycan/xylan/chitin deacetylase (PgdA/CDA1 family)